jgi:hypothetical protein
VRLHNNGITAEKINGKATPVIPPSNYHHEYHWNAADEDCSAMARTVL